ncbi:MAG: thioredoxin family protein, partial [Acidobacteriota bacterium]
DAAHKLAYRGQLDGARPKNDVTVDGKDLRAAMDALLKGSQPDANQMPSIGCNIKWKPGNEPVYFASALVKH